MKNDRTLSLVGAALALSLSMALSGCQTLGDNATQDAAKGAVLGCLGGAGAAILIGEHPAKGCAAGVVFGAASGYYVGRKKDLELAQRAQKDIERAGVADVALATRSEAIPAEKRKADEPASVEVVDKMVVNVPQQLVSRRDPRIGETLDRVGAYVSGVEAPSRVIVAARSEADYNFIVSGIRKGYAQGAEPNKVAYEYRPQTRGTQSSIEVVHHA